MSWSAPMTATANTIWYASQFNKFIRDNLNETAPAKATAAGQYFVPTGNAQITARSASAHTIATSQTTTSSSYTNLSTVGPTVTVTTGPVALVLLACKLSNGSSDNQSHASVAVSGASNIAAHDNWAIRNDAKNTTSKRERTFAFNYITTLKSGSNTFTMKYKVGGGTGTFVDRHMVVFPLS